MVSEGKGQERQRSCEEGKQNLTHCIGIQNSWQRELSVVSCNRKRKRKVQIFFLLLHRASWYHQSLSFTNRCTLYRPYKPLNFTLKLILKLLLHVSVYNHHQGAYT